MRTNAVSLLFLTLLTLVFAVGKIFGYLDWSWVWVASPIWIPIEVMAHLALFYVWVKVSTGGRL
jgi:hypothetical protein